MRRKRYELSTSGFNPDLQLISSDPSGGGYDLGLRVPPTPASSNTPQNRYLFLLAFARFNANQKARIIGMRQLVTIGTYVPSDPLDLNACLYPLELEVTSPFWHFTDGNITWYLQRISPTEIATADAFNGEGQQFGYATTPSLVFDSAPGDIGGYVPTGGGRPYGSPAVSDLSGFHDLRFNAQNGQSPVNSPDIAIEGPCDIALFASVQQTVPATRCKLVLPGGVTTGDIPPEDAFVVNFPDAVYWRISGSLIIEENEDSDAEDEKRWDDAHRINQYSDGSSKREESCRRQEVRENQKAEWAVEATGKGTIANQKSVEQQAAAQAEADRQAAIERQRNRGY